MKLMKIFSAIMVATTMGAAVTVATPGMTADAKAKKSLKTFPKSLRRTWYHYEKNAKGKLVYSKLKFTSKKFTNVWNTDPGMTKAETVKFTLHQFDPAKKLQKGKKNWAIAYKYGKATLWGLWGYSKSEMSYKNALGKYKVVTSKVKGKKVKVLKHTNYVSPSRTVNNYYTNKNLAQSNFKK